MVRTTSVVPFSPCVFDGRTIRSFMYQNQAFPDGHPYRNSTLHTTQPTGTISFQGRRICSRWHGEFREQTAPIGVIQLTFDYAGREPRFWKTAVLTKINDNQWRGYDSQYRQCVITELRTQRWCTYHGAYH